MEIIKIQVTPILAKDWLTKNTKNRALSSSVVMNYAIDMQEGRWLSETGETIKFSGLFEALIDGQHRLKAIILSGTTQEMQVAINCNNEAFKVIDTGKKRKGSDVVSIEGYKHYTLVSSGVRQYLLLKRNNISSGGAKNIDSITEGDKNRKKINNLELLQMVDFLDKSYSVEEIARITKCLYDLSVKTLIPSHIFALIYSFAEKVGFNKVLEVIQSIEAGDSIIQHWKDQKLKRYKFTEHQSFNFHYFAMRSWISKKTYKRVQLNLYLNLQIKDYDYSLLKP